jgi:hypothetical protein
MFGVSTLAVAQYEGRAGMAGGGSLERRCTRLTVPKAQEVPVLAESSVVQPQAPVCFPGNSTIEPSCKARWPAMETGLSMRRTIKPTALQAEKN